MENTADELMDMTFTRGQWLAIISVLPPHSNRNLWLTTKGCSELEDAELEIERELGDRSTIEGILPNDD